MGLDRLWSLCRFTLASRCLPGHLATFFTKGRFCGILTTQITDVGLFGATKTMIELDEFEFPAKDYFWMTFWSVLSWLLYIFAFLTVFLFSWALVSNNWMLPIIISALLFGISPFFAYLSAYWSVDCILTLKRKMTFENGFYHIVLEDGSEGKGPLSHFAKASMSRGYYLLYMSNMYVYPIPFTAFRSEEDRVRFETEILGDKLKKETISWKSTFLFLLLSAGLLALAYLLSPLVDVPCSCC